MKSPPTPINGNPIQNSEDSNETTPPPTFISVFQISILSKKAEYQSS